MQNHDDVLHMLLSRTNTWLHFYMTAEGLCESFSPCRTLKRDAIKHITQGNKYEAALTLEDSSTFGSTQIKVSAAAYACTSGSPYAAAVF